MERLFLTFALLPVLAFAQIGTIETKEKSIDFIYQDLLYRKTESNEYILQITSDNQFEDKAVHLTLGHSPEEAMQSLSNLMAIYNSDEEREFKLQHYSFTIKNKWLYAHHVGYLEYSAGDYILRQNKLTDAMFTLMRVSNLPLGKVHLSMYSMSSHAMFMVFEDYGFYKIAQLKGDFPKLSMEYESGDIIADEDIQVIMKCPTYYNTNQSDFISICEHILQTNKDLQLTTPASVEEHQNTHNN